MKNIILEPIAFVQSSRKVIKDDDWGEVLAEIQLVEQIQADAFDGIDTFSHLEIIFYFHQVKAEKIRWGAAYPRGNTDFPKMGIFAQRKKSRPNLIGTTMVELIERKERIIVVKGLDAIEGTPVLDIKPVMREFLPKTAIQQPNWATELMRNYW